MVEDVDELTLLVLSTAGRDEAIALYEEETGCSRAESAEAVDDLSHRVKTPKKTHVAKRLGMLGAAIVAVGTLALLVRFL